MRYLILIALLFSSTLAAQTDAPACHASTADAASAATQVASAIASYHRQQRQQALTTFNQALALDPCNALAHFYAWRFDELAGSSADARQQLELAHQLSQSAAITRTWNAVQRASILEATLKPIVLTPPLRGFFTRSLDCNGIPIRSSSAVATDALILACDKVLTMLKDIPAARSKLIARGAELHIIGEFEVTTDLPENARFRNTTYIDAEGQSTNMAVRTRGVGGLMSSCGEENLLHLPSDKYGDGSDTCTHEFAHDVMENGLSPHEQGAIEKQYRNAVQHRLWKSAYASVNAKEYWAELSMWFFGAHGNYPSDRSEKHPDGPGPDALRAYDPEGYALLEHLYHQKKP